MESYPLEVIPQWCGMTIDDHNDGMGGCWGILSGFVKQYGEEYCKNCELYKKEEFKNEN